MSRECRLLLTEKQDTIAALHGELSVMKARQHEKIVQQSSLSTGGASFSGTAADSPHEDLQQLLVAPRDVARLTSGPAHTHAGVSSFLLCCIFPFSLCGN